MERGIEDGEWGLADWMAVREAVRGVPGALAEDRWMRGGFGEERALDDRCFRRDAGNGGRGRPSYPGNAAAHGRLAPKPLAVHALAANHGGLHCSMISLNENASGDDFVE